MARKIDVPDDITLDDYRSYAHLAPGIAELESEAALLAPRLRGRTVWMVNSTSQGGGVAEMLPTMVSLLRQLGVAAEWVVIESSEPRFFSLTKRLHNLVHGEGTPDLDGSDREVYEKTSHENAATLREWLAPGDVLVVHDPQPMGLASQLVDLEVLSTIRRCHIGRDGSNDATRAAWSFLAPYAPAYDLAIFSAPEYIPDLFPRSTVVYPAVNPLSRKNRELSVHRVTGVLANSGLTTVEGTVVTPSYTDPARRVGPDGTLVPATTLGEIGLMSRPVITQISRWDRLKGFPWVLDAFARLKQRLRTSDGMDPIQRRRLEIVRLVLAGPDPGAVEDDPEGAQVFGELADRYQALEPHTRDDVALLALPMASRAENAHMVNALQRCSSIVVQNSIREGFGLTVAEAMWKRVPILSNLQACGPRQQVRDGLDGRMIADPTDVEALADAMEEMLRSHHERDLWGRRGQRRVYDEFLVFAQLRKWLRILAEQLQSDGVDVAPDRESGSA